MWRCWLHCSGCRGCAAGCCVVCGIITVVIVRKIRNSEKFPKKRMRTWRWRRRLPLQLAMCLVLMLLFMCCRCAHLPPSQRRPARRRWSVNSYISASQDAEGCAEHGFLLPNLNIAPRGPRLLRGTARNFCDFACRVATLQWLHPARLTVLL